MCNREFSLVKNVPTEWVLVDIVHQNCGEGNGASPYEIYRYKCAEGKIHDVNNGTFSIEEIRARAV